MKLSFIEYKVTVSEKIKGIDTPKEITVRCNSLFKEALPALKNGDKLVFFLIKQTNSTRETNYAIPHPQGGLVLLSDNNNNCYPILRSDKFKHYDGLNITEFKSKINNIK